MTTTLLAFQKQRRDTAANWTSVNPTLLAGEIGLESDTGYWKLGDGSATWTALAYQPWSKLSAYPLVNADIAANAEIAVSKLANGTARQLLQTAANGTDVEWASNIDIPGTLDVTSAATFDSTIGASAGTAALPSITFTGDLNTGIYSPGADQVAVATNGTGRLFVDASGNVGIGTANPSANSVTVSRASGYVECRVNSGSNTATIAVDGTTSYIGNYSNIPLSFTTNSLERLRITSAGLVGVGTSSPSNTLHVVGTGRFNVSGSNNAVIASDSGDPFIYTEQAAGLKFGTNSAVRMTINSSGSVGIGTTSPSELLHIYQPLTNSQAYQLIENNRSRNAATQYKTTLGSWFVGNGIGASVNRFTIYEDGVGDRLVINTSGQVGIGTTSPSQALQVAGAIVATGAATTYSADGIYLQNKGSSIFDISAWRSGASASVLTFSTESGSDASPIERFRCDSSGRLLVGTSTDGGAGGLSIRPNHSEGATQLVFDRNHTTNTSTVIVFENNDGTIGTITYTNTATAYNTTSDYRLKENIVPIIDGITRLQQLKPSRFGFIADPTKTVDGFLAHEAAEVVPECVTGEKDAVDADGKPVYQGIDQSKLVPLLTAALQEAVAKIETLEARLTAAGIE